MELPYLASWVDEGHDEHLQSASNIKRQDYGTVSSSTQRDDPSITETMPYLAPWNDNDSTAVARESYDVPVNLHICQAGRLMITMRWHHVQV